MVRNTSWLRIGIVSGVVALSLMGDRFGAVAGLAVGCSAPQEVRPATGISQPLPPKTAEEPPPRGVEMERPKFHSRLAITRFLARPAGNALSPVTPPQTVEGSEPRPNP